MENDALLEYQYLWNGTDLGWGLIDISLGETREYGIANKMTKMTTIIEDEKIFHAVIQKMLDENVPIWTRKDFL